MASKPFDENLPTAILVHIGKLELAAVLSTSSTASLMPLRTYSSILSKAKECVTDEDGQQLDVFVDACGGFEGIIKRVECKMEIEGEPVHVKMLVVDQLMTDVVLGIDFIRKVNGSFNFRIGSFKWYSDSKINISHFIKDRTTIRCSREDVENMMRDDDFETDDSDFDDSDSDVSSFCDFGKNIHCITMIIQHGSNDKKGTLSTKTPPTKTDKQSPKADKKSPDSEFLGHLRGLFNTSAKDAGKGKPNSTTTKGSKPQPTSSKERQNLKSNYVGDPFQLLRSGSSSGAEREDSELIEIAAKRARKSDKLYSQLVPVYVIPDKSKLGSADGIDWTTVFVLTKPWYNLLVQGGQLANNGLWWGKNHKNNLVFNEALSENTIDGFHLIGVAKVIQQAEDDNVRNLRIVSSRELVVLVVNEFLTQRKLEGKDLFDHFTDKDYTAYRFVCSHAKKLNNVRMEFVECNNDVPEMRLLENKIDRTVLYASL